MTAKQTKMINQLKEMENVESLKITNEVEGKIDIRIKRKFRNDQVFNLRVGKRGGLTGSVLFKNDYSTKNINTTNEALEWLV